MYQTRFLMRCLVIPCCKQAAMSRDLERWCMSRLRGVDLPPSLEPYALLQSPSVECSPAESNLLESTLPLLDLLSGHSSSNSSSLATSVSSLPRLPSSSTMAIDDHNHQTPEGKNFEIKMEWSQIGFVSKTIDLT